MPAEPGAEVADEPRTPGLTRRGTLGLALAAASVAVLPQAPAAALGPGEPWSDGTFWTDGTGWVD
jgi:hypothetical protein